MTERRARRWCLMDMVTDTRTGRLLEAKFWSNVGKLTMTWGFVYVILRGGSSEFLWLAYGGIVVGAVALDKVMNQKQQKLDQQETKT